MLHERNDSMHIGNTLVVRDGRTRLNQPNGGYRHVQRPHHAHFADNPVTNAYSAAGSYHSLRGGDSSQTGQHRNVRYSMVSEHHRSHKHRHHRKGHRSSVDSAQRHATHHAETPRIVINHGRDRQPRHLEMPGHERRSSRTELNSHSSRHHDDRANHDRQLVRHAHSSHATGSGGAMIPYRAAETPHRGSHNHDPPSIRISDHSHHRQKSHRSHSPDTYRTPERETTRYQSREFKYVRTRVSPARYSRLEVTRTTSREYCSPRSTSTNSSRTSAAQEIVRNVKDLSRNLQKLSMETKQRR